MNNLDVLAVRSLLIVLIGLLAAMILRGKAASTRHLFYAGILFSLLLLPVLRQWAPAQSVPVEYLPAPIRFVANQLGSAPQVSLNVLPHQGSAPSTNVETMFVNAIVIVWALGCLLFLSRLVWQLLGLRNLVKRSRLLGVRERQQLMGAASPEGPSSLSACEIRVTPALSVPSTAWMGRPVILLPARYDEWPLERVRSVLLHEAAHISRSDWFVQLIGRLACAIYWPNPLVWLVQRRTMDLAEQSADDLVLEAGVAPSRYAEDLLHIAQTVRSNRAALTTSMALRNDIGRRIEMVLDNKKRRGSVRMGGLLLAGFGIAAATVPAATLLLGHSSVDPREYFADIHDGRFTAATPSNGFTGTLSDGRKVQLLQIGWRLSDGAEQAWRPDGTLLSPKDRLSASLPPKDSMSFSEYRDYPRATTMEFLYRLKKDGESQYAALGYGPDATAPDGEPFEGGWTLPADKGGDMLAVCLMKTPKSGTSDTASYSFYIADGEERTASSYDMGTGATVDHGVYAAHLSVEPNTTAKVYVSGVGGTAFKDEKGNPERRELPAIVVSYDAVQNPAALSIDVVGITRTGRTIESLTLSLKREGPVRHLKAWFPQNAGIERIELQTRKLRATEILGVHVRPNGMPQ